MRELFLSGEWHDFHSIIATMQYPNDDNLRYATYLCMRLSAELDAHQESETVQLRIQDVRTLITSPSKAELAKAATEATKRGIMAGDLLNAMFIMDYFKLDEPSMNKAIFCSQQYNTDAAYGDGSPIPRSERAIKEAWAEFGPVAHLWGAFRLNHAYPFAKGDNRAMFEPANLPRFLGVAAMLQQFGLTFIPKRARPAVPILDADRLIAIPSNIPRVRLHTDRRPDKIEGWLKKYKAPANNAYD